MELSIGDRVKVKSGGPIPNGLSETFFTRYSGKIGTITGMSGFNIYMIVFDIPIKKHNNGTKLYTILLRKGKAESVLNKLNPVPEELFEI